MDQDKLFAQNILRAMDEGVLTLGLDGKVADCNPAAAALLGVEADKAKGLPFARIALAAEGNDDFLQTVLDSVYENRTIRNRIVPFHRPDKEVLSLAVTASLLADEEGERQGAVLVLSDVTELETLREQERSLNMDLTEALRQVDETNKELQSSLSTGRKVRIIVTAAVILLFVGLGVYFWSSGASSEAPDRHAPVRARDGRLPLVEVAPKPLSRTISLSGTVAPLEEVTLAAPFQAKVQKKNFFYGDRVERNQTLIVLDTVEIETQLREARSAWIKARKNLLELQNWRRSPEMAKARREVIQAESRLKRSKEKMEENKVLLEQGIIPKTEYDSSVHEYQDQQMQLTSSRENLASIQSKGDKGHLEIAQMELANARAKLEVAEEKLSQAVIRAPVSGIAIRPSSKEKEGRDVEPGMAVSEGQALLSVASLEGLSITAEVDELDINALEVGQQVMVSGDAFPGVTLKGRIAQLSAQAKSEGQVPTFQAVVRLRDLPVDVEQRVRLGMTAHLQVETYSNPEALLVPLDAVVYRDGKTVVRVSAPTGEVREVEVKTGQTTLTEVEILSGLEPGMKIVSESTGSVGP